MLYMSIYFLTGEVLRSLFWICAIFLDWCPVNIPFFWAKFGPVDYHICCQERLCVHVRTREGQRERERERERVRTGGVCVCTRFSIVIIT